jgi:hypothetical protein
LASILLSRRKGALGLTNSPGTADGKITFTGGKEGFYVGYLQQILTGAIRDHTLPRSIGRW